MPSASPEQPSPLECRLYDDLPLLSGAILKKIYSYTEEYERRYDPAPSAKDHLKSSGIVAIGGVLLLAFILIIGPEICLHTLSKRAKKLFGLLQREDGSPRQPLQGN